jgi:hypothetical protein
LIGRSMPGGRKADRSGFNLPDSREGHGIPRIEGPVPRSGEWPVW